MGEQHCPDCSTFMRRLGIGGACPCCDEAITVAEFTRERGEPLIRE